MKHRLTALTAVVTILIVAALPAWAATKTVTLTADNKFAPGAVTVAVGDSVTFVWDGGFHDVVFADGTSSGAPVGDVGTSYTRTFAAAGSYAYVCTVHEALGMKGSVTVQAAGTSTGTSNNSGSAQTLPFTGPEDHIGPMLGSLMIVAGGVMAYRLRRRA